MLSQKYTSKNKALCYSSSSSAFPAISLEFTILWCDFCVCDHLKKKRSYHRGSDILSSWMMHAGCAFVTGIHPSMMWMSGSFESMQWNACVHRWVIISSERVLGNGVRTQVNSKEKSPLYRRLRGGSNLRRCIMQDREQNTLLTELFRPPMSFQVLHADWSWPLVPWYYQQTASVAWW